MELRASRMDLLGPDLFNMPRMMKFHPGELK